jgi:hypothetical protein
MRNASQSDCIRPSCESLTSLTGRLERLARRKRSLNRSDDPFQSVDSPLAREMSNVAGELSSREKGGSLLQLIEILIPLFCVLIVAFVVVRRAKTRKRTLPPTYQAFRRIPTIDNSLPPGLRPIARQPQAKEKCSVCGRQMVMAHGLIMKTSEFSNNTLGCFQCRQCGRITCYDCSDNRVPCKCGAQEWSERLYLANQ